ncbi:MAG: hypothetical protein V4495_00185 [Pseudomonadota bacterium]
MFVYRFLMVLLLAGMTLIAGAAGIPISNPAKVEDMQQIVHIIGFDQSIQTAIRRDVENTNTAKPEAYLDVEVFMRPFTVDAINLHVSTVMAKYLSNDYAQKLLKELPKPAGRNSTRIAQFEMNQNMDAARREFKKLSPADQKSVNEFRISPTYLSLLNALTNSLEERKEMLGNWSRDELQGRIHSARKVIAELMERGLKAEKEENTDNLNLSDRIPLTGLRSFDQESRLTLNYLRANLKQNLQFSEELKTLQLDKLLLPLSLTTRQGLENSNLSILATETMFDNNSKRFDSLRAAYTTALEKIVMPAQKREELAVSNRNSMERILDFRLRRNEHLRTYIELVKQILSLCENRFGKIKFEANSLIFDNDQDMNQYNAMIKQIDVEIQALHELDKEDWDYRNRSLETFKKK